MRILSIDYTELTAEEADLAKAFLEAILAERRRAHAKHGPTSMEQAEPLDPWRGLILGEEALECGKALNDQRHGDIVLFEPITERTSVNLGLGLNAPAVDPLDKELIQTASMAFTWWANRRGQRLPRVIEDTELLAYGPVAEQPNLDYGVHHVYAGPGCTSCGYNESARLHYDAQLFGYHPFERPSDA